MLCARYEECAELLYFIEPCKVDVSAIHDIERICFNRHDIQYFYIMHFPVADVNKSGDGSAQIQ